jgi:multidrug efflux pump subunit AcrA (membrane-fusion protein)
MAEPQLPGMLPDKFRQERRPTRRAVLAGFLLLAVFLGGFFTWASTAPLESAAIAGGAVALDTNRKIVQHLEGGLIKKIVIREGQKVRINQPLIVLDDTQLRSEIILLTAQIKSVDSQLGYLGEEVVTVEKLLKRGLALKPRLLALYRRRAELEGDRVKHQARMKNSEDKIRRSVIRAPLGGRIVDLKVHTPGGVIKPGDTLMSIVPGDELLVVEARIDPIDIDVVRKGLRAIVHLTPFNARSVAPVEGRVAWVSADSMSDKRSGAAYYLARIELSRNPKSFPKKAPLYPGMPVEVMIVTGERTFLDYIIAPIVRSFRRAFREQ